MTFSAMVHNRICLNRIVMKMRQIFEQDIHEKVSI